MKRLEARRKRFQEIALPHLNALYRTARQLVGEDAAPDLVQETYLRAWKYFDTFDAGTNCRAWLFRILRNASADHWRRSRLEIPWVEAENAPEPYYDWEESFLGQQFSGDVQQALAELPEEYRWAVLLVDVEEFSYQEVAQILSCPVGTVMSRINRGRRMLARLLRSRGSGRVSEQQRPTHKPEAGKS